MLSQQVIDDYEQGIEYAEALEILDMRQKGDSRRFLIRYACVLLHTRCWFHGVGCSTGGQMARQTAGRTRSLCRPRWWLSFCGFVRSSGSAWGRSQEVHHNLVSCMIRNQSVLCNNSAQRTQYGGAGGGMDDNRVRSRCVHRADRGYGRQGRAGQCGAACTAMH